MGFVEGVWAGIFGSIALAILIAMLRDFITASREDREREKGFLEARISTLERAVADLVTKSKQKASYK